MFKSKKKWLMMLLMVIMILSLPLSAQAKVRLNKKKVTIGVNKTVQLKVKGTKKKAKWSSYNKNIAKVSKKGKVTGVHAGKTTVVAKVGKKKYKCKITVKPVRIVSKTTTHSSSTPSPSNSYASIEAGVGVDKTKVLTFTGSGDDVVNVPYFGSRYVFEITGNDADRYFGVIPYKADGTRMSSLVNTTDPYHGIVYNPEQAVSYLEVKAEDSWVIKMKSIYSVPIYSKGNLALGSGDAVILLNGGNNGTAYISGNNADRYFGVIPYDHSGKRLISLVNTTDPYSGRVLLKNDPWIYVIKAEDAWSIQF